MGLDWEHSPPLLPIRCANAVALQEPCCEVREQGGRETLGGSTLIFHQKDRDEIQLVRRMRGGRRRDSLHAFR